MEIVQGEFVRIWRDFRWIKPNEVLILNTRELIFSHGLRGYDAVHLASSLLLKEESDGMDIFFHALTKP